MAFFTTIFPQFFILFLKYLKYHLFEAMTWFWQPLIQLIIMEMVVLFDHCKDVGEENKENIKEVNNDFISMKGNLCSLKNSRGEVPEKQL